MTSPFLLIKRSFKIFTKKENLISLVKIYLPIGILSTLSLATTYIPSFSEFTSSVNGKIIMNVLNLLFLVVTVFVNLAGTIAVSKIINEKKFTWKEVYQASFQKFWKYLALSILIYLLYILGLVLLIVPLVMFSTWYIFSKFIMVEGGSSIKSCFKESKKIVKGNFWKVLVRNLVFVLFYICAEMIIAFFPYGIGTVLFSLIEGLFILPTYLLFKEMNSVRIVNG